MVASTDTIGPYPWAPSAERAGRFASRWGSAQGAAPLASWSRHGGHRWSANREERDLAGQVPPRFLRAPNSI
jgi:hypothetical protein